MQDVRPREREQHHRRLAHREASTSRKSNVPTHRPSQVLEQDTPVGLFGRLPPRNAGPRKTAPAGRDLVIRPSPMRSATCPITSSRRPEAQWFEGNVQLLPPTPRRPSEDAPNFFTCS